MASQQQLQRFSFETYLAMQWNVYNQMKTFYAMDQLDPNRSSLKNKIDSDIMDVIYYNFKFLHSFDDRRNRLPENKTIDIAEIRQKQFKYITDNDKFYSKSGEDMDSTDTNSGLFRLNTAYESWNEIMKWYDTLDIAQKSMLDFIAY